MSEKLYWNGRGNPWDYDPGPAKNLSWIRLFSETPNYRQLSKEALSKEKFRWHFGPMYYRGRLTPNSVKVMIIGQEGAQDESLAHRSFSGSTGGRMQHFLNFIGINYSYLFVNTFVYPIFSQYFPNIKWLAQDPNSPIVKQRHLIFNFILKKNDIQLIVAVGTAAKESVVSWVESKGGICPDGSMDISTATGSLLDPKIKMVGVLHPGGARKTEEKNKIVASFQTAIDKIKIWDNQDPGWLTPDTGMTRDLEIAYTYSKAPIPFKDLPLGICWRLGNGSTSSNRRDDQRSIQLFSADGKYNNRGDDISYTDLALGSNEGYSESDGDVAYEPPVHFRKSYDKGPGRRFARLFQGGYSGLNWPDFNMLGATAHPSFGTGPVYRGRPYQGTVLILSDQQSQDDLFTHRALTGDAGQRFQAWLSSIGITESYCILRVFPVDTLDLDVTTKTEIAGNPQIINVYNAIVTRILAKGKTRLILSVGVISGSLIDQLDTGNMDVVKLKSWIETGANTNWQNALGNIQNKSYPKDIANPSFTYNGERIQIPRHDLPYGTLKWQGSSGDRTRRALLPDGSWSPDYYKHIMPDWAYLLEPQSLTPAELKAIENHP